jgi:hypothetical protein
LVNDLSPEHYRFSQILTAAKMIRLYSPRLISRSENLPRSVGLTKNKLMTFVPNRFSQILTAAKSIQILLLKMYPVRRMI